VKKFICDYCGKEFYRPTWHRRKSGGIFCSRECVGKNQQKEYKAHPLLERDLKKYFGLIKYFAFQHKSSFHDDLISVGMIAMLKASATADRSSEKQLFVYYGSAIKNAMSVFVKRELRRDVVPGCSGLFRVVPM